MFDDSIEKLRRYFSSKKIVKAQFERPVAAAVLAELNPSRSGDMSAEFEVDVEKDSLQSVISELFEKLPVADIDVGNVNIEEVIKYLYTGCAGAEREKV
jgi:ABC-2 type transport system ATP-binding protein